MEKWEMIIAYLQLSAVWVQVIIAFIAVFAGLKYLDQHKKKVRIERNALWVEKIIQTYFEIELLGHDVIAVNSSFNTVVAKLYGKEATDLPPLLRESFVKFTLIKNEYMNKKNQFRTMFSSIAVPIDFLRDDQAEEIHTQTISLFISIFTSIDINLSKLSSSTKSSLSHLESQDFDDYIRKIYNETIRELPRNFTDIDNLLILNYHTKTKELREYLIKKYIP
ncbi:hypothetical protein J2X69_004011 [Algoriphagus sp. 4150]|uniref:hypothetical protein n=1 Tax=Algoriphagus sp. 4150 TaxID=2817756 RepID=UPI00286229D5|nr:hypothetical protein [Algoriphagus sp. 4150]MDR7131647.1 hypothetical protein [Algoriphagus sp. 4150]